MNAAQARESQIGPPSEPIDIAKFIQSAVDIMSREAFPCDVFTFSEQREPLPDEMDLAAECR